MHPPSPSDGTSASQSDLITLDRPPINYASLREFSHSVWGRFKSLWTRRFTLSLLAGQVVSLCITCTNVTTTELVNRNWANATTQTFFLWVIFIFLSCVLYVLVCPLLTGPPVGISPCSSCILPTQFIAVRCVFVLLLVSEILSVGRWVQGLVGNGF